LADNPLVLLSIDLSFSFGLIKYSTIEEGNGNPESGDPTRRSCSGPADSSGKSSTN
jgi:hypothetical protein